MENEREEACSESERMREGEREKVKDINHIGNGTTFINSI